MQGVCTRCGAITLSGPRCERHLAGIRPSLRARGYPSDWEARRRAQLRREPRCQAIVSGQRCQARATVADHRVRRRDLVARRHPDPDGPWNLQSLCATHHGRKTAEEIGWSPAPG